MTLSARACNLGIGCGGFAARRMRGRVSNEIMARIGAVVCAAVLLAAGGLAGALLGAGPARAENCPGNPDALGTSRVLVVSPEQYKRLGTMQYKHTLPLADHEVVITFDDGPLPPWSDKVLDILQSRCVKATYFIIGVMAQQFPEVVRREYEAGDTIGLHSQTHPTHFERLSGAKLDYQIDGAMASVSAALGDSDAVAPFFRIPGLAGSKIVEGALAARSLVVFSADVVADDWFHHIRPEQIVARAISRLEKRGSGILLLHDIHPATVAALPMLLAQLKEHGFHVVQIVPPAHAGPQMAGGPAAWAREATMPQAALVDLGAVSPAWPQPNVTLATADDQLPVPDAAVFTVGAPLARLPELAGIGSPGIGWPDVPALAAAVADADLAVPGLPDIGVSLRDETLVGQEVAMRPKLDTSISVDHRRAKARERPRHVRLRHHFRSRGRYRHRADSLSGPRDLFARLTSPQAA
jgi:peptidoglycan-N-acetylglucosamine deacetylase